jgi:hypothetical protein
VYENTTRKVSMVESIFKDNSKLVGFFRLVMEAGLEKFRASAIQETTKRIKVKE